MNTLSCSFFLLSAVVLLEAEEQYDGSDDHHHGKRPLPSSSPLSTLHAPGASAPARAAQRPKHRRLALARPATSPHDAAPATGPPAAPTAGAADLTLQPQHPPFDDDAMPPELRAWLRQHHRCGRPDGPAPAAGAAAGGAVQGGGGVCVTALVDAPRLFPCGGHTAVTLLLSTPALLTPSLLPAADATSTKQQQEEAARGVLCALCGVPPARVHKLKLEPWAGPPPLPPTPPNEQHAGPSGGGGADAMPVDPPSAAAAATGPGSGGGTSQPQQPQQRERRQQAGGKRKQLTAEEVEARADQFLGARASYHHAMLRPPARHPAAGAAALAAAPAALLRRGGPHTVRR